jgi:hypothetical protein
MENYNYNYPLQNVSQPQLGLFNQNYYPNPWSHNMAVQNQFHNSEDIESDVMDEESDDTNSGSDDEDDSNSEEGPEDDAKQLEEEENYIRFVQSVFCDDDMVSTASFTDEEDEEYNPDDKEDEEDDDFDGNDRDKVKDKELQGLVNECWQTIVGEAPVLPNGVGDDDDEASFSCDMNMNNLDTETTTEGTTITDKALKLNNNMAQSFHSPTKKRRDSSVEGVLSPHKAPLFPSEATASNSASDARSNSSITSSPSKSAKLSNCGSNKGRVSTASQSVLSSIVSQLFAGDTPSEVCVEGMPVDAIRKLVARQMSMATQLLVQILLQADEKSECFTTAYTSLMELSNLRDTALKKAKLIEMNMQNVNSIRHSHAREQKQQQSSQHSQPSESEEGEKTHVEVVERRLTRSGVGTAVNARSSSVFDIPALTHVQGLFDAIDSSRKAVKAQLIQSGAQPKVPSVTFSDDLTGTGLLLAVGTEQAAGQSGSAESASSAITPSDAASRARLLSLSSVQTTKIMKASGMRSWSCLAPLSHYPLHEALMLRTDPSSLTGRSMFTPAEDDLLLRGIITLGENAWSRIKTAFLPSKEAQLLQFRFTQMTNLSAPPDSNNFKRYMCFFNLTPNSIFNLYSPGIRNWRWSTARGTPSGLTRRTWICSRVSRSSESGGLSSPYSSCHRENGGTSRFDGAICRKSGRRASRCTKCVRA